MKILVVSSYLPFPLHSGGHIRLYNLIKRLSKHHEITLVCETRSQQTPEDLNKIQEICKKVITVPRKKQWSISNILKTGFSITQPFLLMGHNHSEMKNKIQNLLDNEKFDLIHVETFYVSQNIPHSTVPTLVIEHNIEYDVYKRFADRAKLLIKPLLLLDILKLRLAEEKVWKKADAVVAVSNQDRDIIDQHNKKVYVIPNGVDIDKFPAESKAKSKEKTLLYIGDFKWIQNKDAVRFILKEVWPRLEADFQNLNLRIVGKNIPDDIKKYASKRIIVDENAPEETSEIFAKSDILLAPIRVGGGTSYKILESMASGVPVVTTSLGALGIGAIDNEHIAIANEADEMIMRVKKLLEDEEYFTRIAKNARALIEKKYDWDIITADLEKVYKAVVSQ